MYMVHSIVGVADILLWPSPPALADLRGELLPGGQEVPAERGSGQRTGCQGSPQKVRLLLFVLVCFPSLNVLRALPCLISVTVFTFTHPPALSALLLILSASRFLAPDVSLLVPVPFLSWPLCVEWPSPSSLTGTLSGLIQVKPQNFSFSKTIDLPCFPFHAAVFLCLKSLLSMLGVN